MKKTALYVLTCVLSLSFFSCSTENNDETTEARKFGVKPKSLPANEIVYKILKKENYPNLVAVNEELALIRQNFDSELYIKGEEALYTEYDGKHTYTFKTDRADRKENETENIVLESRADGTYNSYYFKYYFTGRELTELDKLSTETILSRTEIVPLVSGNGAGLINISCFEAVQNYTGKWICEAGNEHEPGNPNCQVGGSTWTIQPTTLSYVYVGCDGNAIGGGGPGGGSGSGSGGSSGGGSGSGNGGSDGGSTGGGSGSGGSEPDPNYSFVEGQTIVTQPVQLTTPSQTFFSGLNSQQQQWALDNGDTYADITNYLTEENWSEESKDFAKDLIDFAMQNENNKELARQILEVLEEEEYSDESIEAAINAIEDIDNGIVPANILNLIDKECQREVINDILQVSSPFTNVIQQTFNTSEVVNLQFRNGNLPSNGNAYTNPLPIGSYDNYTIDIKFRDDYIDTCTDLSLVASALHEMVHAYLIDLFLKDVLVAENEDYETLLNAFLNFYKDSNQVTFTELDNEIHNAMIDFIQKMANSIYNYAQSKNMSNVTVDYCIALAWAGMQGTELYNNILTSQEQMNYGNIGYYEQENTGSKIGNACP